jgi:hypothetical protein
MQVLPRIHKNPQEVLGLADVYTVENILTAYRLAMAKQLERRTLENAGYAEDSSVTEIEWAFKELMALKRSTEGDSDGEEGVVSAILLPGLAQGTAETLGKEGNNVVTLSSRRDSKDVYLNGSSEQDQSIPDLKDILEKVAQTAKSNDRWPSSEKPFLSSQKTPEKTTAPIREDSFKLSSPLSSRSFAPNLVTPKTIRTVIGGDDKPVVHTVSPLGLTKETQLTYQGILARAEHAKGELLRNLREAAGVDSWELSQRTRISLEHLTALETDDYDNLPAPVYYRGYLCAYLKYLGIQRSDLIDALCETFRIQKRSRAERNK